MSSIVSSHREMMMAVGFGLYTPFLADVSPHLKAKVGFVVHHGNDYNRLWKLAG